MTRGQALKLLAHGSLLLFLCALVTAEARQEPDAYVFGLFFALASIGWVTFVVFLAMDARRALPADEAMPEVAGELE